MLRTITTMLENQLRRNQNITKVKFKKNLFLKWQSTQNCLTVIKKSTKKTQQLKREKEQQLLSQQIFTKASHSSLLILQDNIQMRKHLCHYLHTFQTLQKMSLVKSGQRMLLLHSKDPTKDYPDQLHQQQQISEI